VITKLNNYFLSPPPRNCISAGKRLYSPNAGRSTDQGYKSSVSTFDPLVPGKDFIKKSNQRNQVLKSLRINTQNASLKSYIKHFEK